MKQLIPIFFAMIAILYSIPASAVETTVTGITEEEVILYVNINTDSAEKMADLLNGVGPTKAAAIVAFRDANGDFMTIDDLLAVPGIGPATLEKNRAVIVLSQLTN